MNALPEGNLTDVIDPTYLGDDMAGAMRKVGEYLGLVEHGEYDDELESYEPVAERSEPRPAKPAPARVARLDERRPTPVPAPRDIARIEKVVPTTYGDARRIGENFRAGVPVIMNLSEIAEDEAKRLVDFAAGLVFAVHGSLDRITAKVFLLTPEDVEVTDEDKKRLATGGGFYDQA